MNIVITGAGKVGSTLCGDLVKENHNITIIEQNESRLEQVINTFDINGLAGNGAAYDSQEEAGVSQCDIFIAVTSNDEVNILAAITAKKLGARYTVARVRNPGYSKQIDFLRDNLGITLMINPELDAANSITRMLLFPSALDVEVFGQGRIHLVETILRNDAPMIGIRLRELGGRFGNIIVCVVVRGEEVLIPDGETRLKAGDHVWITGEDSDIHAFCRHSQHGPDKIGSALIIGGGRVANYLVANLLKMHIRVKVIEINQDSADKLASEFPHAEVALGDGTQQSFLREEHGMEYDALIALTGIDEENILISIYASRMGVPKTITKVNRTDLLKVLENVGLQAIITPQRIVADHIVRFVRSTENAEGSNIDAFYRLADGKVEVLQFIVRESSKAIRIKLTELSTKPGMIFICFIRDGKTIFPGGQSFILPGDNVILATTNKGFQDLDDILLERQVHR